MKPGGPVVKVRQGRRTLVLGGMRSGKSTWAERALDGITEVTYIATAPSRPGDDDWDRRVLAHRSRRPAHWHTVEMASTQAVLAELISTASARSAVLVDDLGTWLTAVLDQTGGWERPDGARSADPACDDLIDAVGRCSARLLLVSPEVGWGVVPATRAGRVFADAQGQLNQRLAAACDNVVLVVAGLALPLGRPGFDLDTPEPSVHDGSLAP